MTDVLLVLFLYAILAVSYFGWGRVGIFLLGTETPALSRFITVWLGWALSLLLLETIHLVFPIDYRISSLVFAAGICFSIPELRRLARGRTLREIFRCWPFIVVMTPVIIWVICRSMVNPGMGDTGLYYLGTIHWINSYPIVPGLGNLHGRFAFNQSYFLYEASLQFYP